MVDPDQPDGVCTLLWTPFPEGPLVAPKDRSMHRKVPEDPPTKNSSGHKWACFFVVSFCGWVLKGNQADTPKSELTLNLASSRFAFFSSSLVPLNTIPQMPEAHRPDRAAFPFP